MSGGHVGIDPLCGGGLDAAEKIAVTAPDPWRRADLAAALEDERRVALAARLGASRPDPEGTGDGTLAGFICLRVLGSEAELEMLAVDPAARRLGVGRALVQAGLAACKKRGATRCLLELRAGNTAALRLYESLGFTLLAKRPAMYASPREDGLCMELVL